jgi:putative endonuclease
MGELDIVAARDELLLFVEVRSVSTDYLDGPELSVTPTKQRRVASAAEIWLSEKGSHYEDIRFDVIGVRWRMGLRSNVEHIPDAFVPSWAI